MPSSSQYVMPHCSVLLNIPADMLKKHTVSHSFGHFYCAVSGLLKALEHIQVLASEILQHFTIRPRPSTVTLQPFNIHADVNTSLCSTPYTWWFKNPSHLLLYITKIANVSQSTRSVSTSLRCIHIHTVLGWAALVTQFHWRRSHIESPAQPIPSHHIRAQCVNAPLRSVMIFTNDILTAKSHGERKISQRLA